MRPLLILAFAGILIGCQSNTEQRTFAAESAPEEQPALVTTDSILSADSERAVELSRDIFTSMMRQEEVDSLLGQALMSVGMLVSAGSLQVHNEVHRAFITRWAWDAFEESEREEFTSILARYFSQTASDSSMLATVFDKANGEELASLGESGYREK